MKIKAFFILFLLLASLAVFSQRLFIEGKYAGEDGTMLYLKRYSDRQFITIDSTRTSRGKFFFNRPATDVWAYGVTSHLTAKQPPIFFAGADSLKLHLDEATGKLRVQQAPTDSLYRLLLPWTQREDFAIDSLARLLPASPLTPYFALRTPIWKKSVDELKGLLVQMDTLLRYNHYYQELERFVAAREAIAVGNIAPNFQLRAMNGQLVQLKDFRQRPVVLSFWASWCGDCRREVPLLKKEYARLQAQGVAFVSISLDTSFQQWKDYLAKVELPWLQLCDFRGWNSSVAPLYALRWVPTTFIIDKEGRILSVSYHHQELEKNLREAFPE